MDRNSLLLLRFSFVNNGKQVKSWQSVALTIKQRIWWASVSTRLVVSNCELHKLSVSALQLGEKHRMIMYCYLISPKMNGNRLTKTCHGFSSACELFIDTVLFHSGTGMLDIFRSNLLPISALCMVCSVSEGSNVVQLFFCTLHINS